MARNKQQQQNKTVMSYKRMMAIQWLMNRVIEKGEILIDDIEAASHIEKANIMQAYEKALDFPHCMGGVLRKDEESEAYFETNYQ
jgi:hypothetical protein